MLVRAFISVLSLCSLASCGLGNLQLLRSLQPRGNAFQNALANEYREFADSQEQKHDFIDAQYFAKKGLRAARGENVLPDKVENWSISGDTKATLRQARVYLMEVLTPELTTRIPQDTARTQLLFDCWLEQQEGLDDEEQIPPCREEFYEMLDNLYAYKYRLAHGDAGVGTATGAGGNSQSNASTSYSTQRSWHSASGATPYSSPFSSSTSTTGNSGSLHTGGNALHPGEDEYVATGTSSATVQPDVIENPKQTFTLYFDFNSIALKKASEAKLHEVVSQLKKFKRYEVVVSGHTDRAGSKSYNNGLSQRRAETVKNKLVSYGIDRNRISAFGYGELYPKVQTADGVKNKANRRVHIVIREKAK